MGDRESRPTLRVLRGGRSEDGRPRRPVGRLRLIEGGEASDMQAAIEETVQAARRMRQEIEERIARSLDDNPTGP